MHSGSDPSKLLRLRIHVQPRFIHRYRYLHERIAALDVGEAEGGGDDSRLAEYNVEEGDFSTSLHLIFLLINFCRSVAGRSSGTKRRRSTARVH